MKKQTKKIIAAFAFTALLAIPVIGSMVDSSSFNLVYVMGATENSNYLRDVGSIVGGSGAVLTGLSILCGFQGALVAGFAL
jgi:hypothetical protein